jgi:hypothetical protein
MLVNQYILEYSAPVVRGNGKLPAEVKVELFSMTALVARARPHLYVRPVGRGPMAPPNPRSLRLLEVLDGQDKKGQGLCPVHPPASPPRGSGCSKDRPYPPDGQSEYIMTP